MLLTLTLVFDELIIIIILITGFSLHKSTYMYGIVSFRMVKTSLLFSLDRAPLCDTYEATLLFVHS